MLLQVHQDFQYPLMLKLYRTQENTQTPNSQCLQKGKYLSKNRFLSTNLDTTNNLNIVKCNVCLECHIQKNVLPDHESYISKKCHTWKDPDYFLKNNLHPVWFEVNKDGSNKVDSSRKKFPILASHMNLKDSLLPNDCSFKDVQLLYHQFIYQMVALH